MGVRMTAGPVLTLALLVLGAGPEAQKTTQIHPGAGGSPHARTEWTVEGANFTIEYGRPYVKGRKIFGGLEPYGRAWRLGADEATMLKTTKDLVIGGVTVPAGSYTLFAWLDEKAWKLIVNEETGQWGLDYHADRDLARIDMKTERIPQLVEQLIISIDPTPGGGTLKVEWENTRSSVPFTVKQGG